MVIFLNKKIKFYLWIIAFLATGCKPVYSDNNKISPSRDSTVVLASEYYQKDNKLILALNFNIAKKKHIYWRSVEGFGYPTTVDYQESGQIQEMQIIWPNPDIFTVNNKEQLGYTNNVVIPLKFQLGQSKTDIKIKLTVDYLVCDLVCIPRTAEIDRLIKYKSDHINNNLNEYVNFITNKENSKRITAVRSKKKSIIVEFNDKVKNVKLFVEDTVNKKIISSSLVPDLNSSKNYLLNLTNGSYYDSKLLLHAYVDGKYYATQQINNNIVAQQDYSLLWMLFLALLSGLVLNFMPCALPALSIKAIACKNGNRQDVLLTGLGIIIAFAILGSLIGLLKYLGFMFQLGMHLQNSIFIITMILMLSFACMDFVGIVRIPYLSLLNNNYDTNITNHTIKNIISGCFIVALSLSCITPFISSVIIFTFSSSYLVILLLFICLGIGMALPYLLIATFKQAGQIMPKPGAWHMWLVRVSFIIFTIINLWLFYLLSYHFSLLNFCLVSLIIIFILLIYYLYYKTKIQLHYYRIISFILFILLLAITTFTNHSSIKLANQKSQWQKFSADKIVKTLDLNYVVLVNVTAQWCITCHINKALVLNDAFLQKYANNVVFIEADWTLKDPAISEYINYYNRSGVPLNVVYGPKNINGIVLPILLDNEIVEQAIKAVQ